VATRTNQRHNNLITDFDRTYARPNFFDYPNAFVAKNGWQRATPCAIGVRNVAVANRGSQNLHTQFAGLRFGEIYFFYNEWFTKLTTDCSFHFFYLSVFIFRIFLLKNLH
jgi:hypothetical protein